MNSFHKAPLFIDTLHYSVTPRHLVWALLASLLSGCASSNDNTTQSAAYELAKTAIERQIKPPLTATFPAWDKVRYAQKGNAIDVIGYVDLQTSAGTKRDFWAAKLHQADDKNSWILDSADLAIPISVL